MLTGFTDCMREVKRIMRFETLYPRASGACFHALWRFAWRVAELSINFLKLQLTERHPLVIMFNSIQAIAWQEAEINRET
jgi:hypothetical protein